MRSSISPPQSFRQEAHNTMREGIAATGSNASLQQFVVSELLCRLLNAAGGAQAAHSAKLVLGCNASKNKRPKIKKPRAIAYASFQSTHSYALSFTHQSSHLPFRPVWWCRSRFPEFSLTRSREGHELHLALAQLSKYPPDRLRPSNSTPRQD